LKIAFYGSSLLSSYWNGAATYYRGLLRDLAHRGWEVHFYEPDAFDRQQHRDMDPPDWAQVTVWEATPEDARRVMAQAAYADVVVKASGVGVFDDELLNGLLDVAAPEAVRMFCDVDAAATLEEMRGAPDHALRRRIGDLDLVTTYGGGPPVVTAYTEVGARRIEPIYNALDPETHHPVEPDPRFAADLNFLANRLPDREARVEAFFLRAAELLPDKRFLLGGNGWADKPMSDNVQRIGHVGTGDHNAFNTSSLAVLNVARDSMAAMGFSPATRVFEAAGAGACLITDAWEGIEMFLKPDAEVLVARDGQEVAEHVRALTPGRAGEIGEAGRARILSEHTYERRGAQLDAILREEIGRKRGAARTLGGSGGGGPGYTEGRFA
jgi:spore maturation protein CgeB